MIVIILESRQKYLFVYDINWISITFEDMFAKYYCIEKITEYCEENKKVSQSYCPGLTAH